MKRLFALILTLAMVCSLSLSASAVGAGDLAGGISGDKNKDIKVTVTGVSGDAATIYYVVIDWENMTFTYNYNEGTSTYDPEHHVVNTAAGDGTLGWVDGRTSAKVTVTNHSNASINVSAALGENTDPNVTASLTGAAKVLPSAVGKAVTPIDPELVATYTVNIAGKPAKANAAAFKINELTITIA